MVELSVVSAKDLHSQPFCSPDNLNLYNASNGEFILQNDGSFRYQVHNCKLRRFRVKDAEECLRGQHLVFMGDSLSRYFYLNLASLFAFGKWPLRFVEQFPNGLSYLSEKEYGNWAWFFSDTNTALNQGYHAVEICDCFRNDTETFLDFIKTMYENRHFRYMPRGNLQDNLVDVRLSYIQWWGYMPMRGHLDISTKLPRTGEFVHAMQELNHNLCPRGGQSFYPLTRDCFKQRPELHKIDFPPFSWEDICTNYPQPTYEASGKNVDMCQRFEREVLQAIKATHLIMNIGWHSNLKRAGPNFFPKVTNAAAKFFDRPPTNLKLPRVTFRGSTAGAIFELSDVYARNFSLQQGYDTLGFFTVGEITKKLQLIDKIIVSNDTALLKKTVRLNHRWPSDREVNLSTVHRIWHDNAHFEPYAYSEINNLFLNAVCPLQ